MIASLLLLAQLPPPPSPDGTSIDTARVVGVVVLALGLIAVASVALRPLIARKQTPAGPIEESAAEPTPRLEEPKGPRAIIPFPSPSDSESGWQDAAAVTDRLQQVLGRQDRRRKLGDRNPGRVAVRAAEPGLQRRLAGARATGPRGRVIPLYDHLGESLVLAHPTWTRADIDSPRRQPDVPAVIGVTVDHQPADEPTPGVPDAVGAEAISSIGGETGAPPAAASVEPMLEASSAPVAFRPEQAAPAAQTDGLQSDRPPEPLDAAPTIDAHAAVPVVPDEVIVDAPSPSSTDDGANLAAEIGLPPEIGTVISELVQCANEGRVVRGLALYSDDHLFRFMDSTGLSDDEFRDAFSRVQPRPPDRWERVGTLVDPVELADGRIEVTASYVGPDALPVNGRERYRMVFDADRAMWMIDDIAPVEDAG